MSLRNRDINYNKASLALDNYIKDFDINLFSLASLAFLVNKTDNDETSISSESENEPIKISKAIADDIKEPESYNKAIESKYKKYWFKPKLDRERIYSYKRCRKRTSTYKKPYFRAQWSYKSSK